MPRILISEIDVSGRYRQDLGDIKDLADSISAIGLLHPIVVTPDNKLIVGERRLRAYELLGRDTIEANIAKNLTEAHDLLRAEGDENRCRKQWNPVEYATIGAALEKLLRPKAEEKQKAGLGEDGSGGRGRKKNPRGTSPKVSKQDESARTTALAAAVVGVDRRTYEKAKAVVASRNKSAIAEMQKTGKVNRAYKQVQRDKATKTEPQPLPEGTFDLILADPPWKYDFAETTNREIENQYQTMDADAISALSPPAAKDAVLFLWATAPKLKEALVVMESWGFTYKTHAVWDKQKIGMGYWFRGQHELLLVGTRGKASPPDETQRVSSLFSFPRGPHSAKPTEVYDILEKMLPKARRCEMFARQPREGWSSWGNQL